MGFWSFLKILTIAVAAAGLSFVAQRHDLLVAMVAALAAALAVIAFLLRAGGQALRMELGLLREHLETTRQQAAMLARMTREMRDSVVHQEAQGHATPPLPAEWSTLSEIVRDIADEMTRLDQRTAQVEDDIAALHRAPGRAGRATMGGASPEAHSAPPPHRETAREEWPHDAMATPAPVFVGPKPVGPMPVTRPGAPMPEAEMLAGPSRAIRQLVAAAIAADRFELFLQRIVSLPQRKVRAYEVSLRPDGCDPRVTTDEIRLAVEHVGHQLSFDRKLIVQAVRLARLFEQRQRDVTLMVDLSQRYLLSETALEELRALLADAPGLPRRIVLSLPQRFFRKAIAVENEVLRQLGAMGFRFMMREVTDPHFELAQLEAAQVRWMRMDASRLIAASQSGELALEVAAADFAALLGRRQISLLVEGVDDERTVAELIDFNVAYAQGHVFAPPQPVRPDALDGMQAPGARREAGAGENGAVANPAGEGRERHRQGIREIARRA